MRYTGIDTKESVKWVHGERQHRRKDTPKSKKENEKRQS